MTTQGAALDTTEDRWVPTASEFGTRLAMVRQKKGWNLTEASLKSGLGQNDWARYEGGASPRKLAEVVTKISAATNVDANWLLWGPGSTAPIGGGTTLYGVGTGIKRTLTARIAETSGGVPAVRPAVVASLDEYRQRARTA